MSMETVYLLICVWVALYWPPSAWLKGRDEDDPKSF